MLISNQQQQREAMVEAARRLTEWGLNQGRTGNISLRTDSGCLITPTGMLPEDLTAADMVALDHTGTPFPDQRVPSSEWRFHVDVFRERPDIHAIVHTHSTYATAMACCERPIPAFHYMIAETGGDHISVARYATFGTQALSDHIIAALSDRYACLMANHGQLAAGRDLRHALQLSQLVEELAKQYCITQQLGGPSLLDEKEMQVMLEKFKTYGKDNE